MSDRAARPPVRPAETSSYDEVPYEGRAVADTHLRNLAVMARLHGIASPDPAAARVLELGCGRGDNLLAMASTLPKAALVGVDGSPRQIAAAEGRRKAAALSNAQFVAADFTSLADPGEFDYVICHGVYSWVSEETADLLLKLCRRCLSPRGIAFVSFNALPGSQTRSMLREMVLFHVRSLTDSKERIEQARAFVELLARFAVEEQGTYRARLSALAESIEEGGDSYLFHEYLEPENRPLYFAEFARRAAQAGLRYVASSRSPVWQAFLPSEVRELLEPIRDRILREQYLDFLSDRPFRRVLLVREDVDVADREDERLVTSLFVSAEAQGEGPPGDPASAEPRSFRGSDEAGITTNRPLVKAALSALEQEAPRSLSFDALREETRRLAGPSEQDAAPGALVEFLLRAFSAGLVALSLEPIRVSCPPPEEPLATPLARIQAAEDPLVTSLLHRPIRLDAVDRIVLAHCDGTRGRRQLETLLAEEASRGRIELADESGAPLRDPARLREYAPAAVARSLDRLARLAFFSER
jgi:methyltransferase-like protein/ubiquinone/menaquinone biosynthesis C-methylase UbiE